MSAGYRKGLAVGAMLAGAAINAWSGQELEVSATRVVAQHETVQAVRQGMERELRKEALRRSPTIIEWDRDLRGDAYSESVKEMSLATVRLSSFRERVEVDAKGQIILTVVANAVVDDAEVQRWAARLDETERLRAELSDARRRESINARREASRNTGRGELKQDETVSSSVRMRLGDGADLADLAKARAGEATGASREALIEMLRSSVIALGPVKVSASESGAWTEFDFGVNWKLAGFDQLARSYLGRVAFKGEDGLSGIRFFDRLGAASSAWRAADDLIWTRISLEINTDAGKASVPVAYAAYRVSMIGEAACVETYGTEYERQYPTRSDMGWCLAVEGSTDAEKTSRRPDMRNRSKVWVRSQDVAKMTGPEVTWSVRWADGSVARIKPVVQWKESVAQGPK